MVCEKERQILDIEIRNIVNNLEARPTSEVEQRNNLLLVRNTIIAFGDFMRCRINQVTD